MYAWSLILIVVCLLSAYASKLSNDQVPFAWVYIVLAGITNALVWSWVTKTSKNLLFDSILYDIIMVIIFTGMFIIFKCGTTSFSNINWIGLTLAISGLILMKL